MTGQDLVTVTGNTFVVSDPLGNIRGSKGEGIFVADTRLLSRYELRLREIEVILLRSGPADAVEDHIYATNVPTDRVPGQTLEIVRRRRLDDHFVDAIALTNRGLERLDLHLDLVFDADFADIFEVRAAEGTRPPRRSVGRTENGQIVFYDRRRRHERMIRIHFSPGPDAVRRAVARFAVALPPGVTWEVEVTVDWTVPHPVTTQPIPVPRVAGKGAVREWLRQAPILTTEDHDLQLAYERAIRDLAALELALNSGAPIPAAGLPWYLAIFGRDAIIASLQSLLLGPHLADGTLRALAAYQASRTNAFRDAEPGKIVHEIRFGELASAGTVPHARYYGTVDATPLWLILLAEVYRWTGDRALLDDLLPNADRALRWIDRYGDRDGDGLIEYERRSAHGLANQGWKDSWDSIRFADGRFAQPPIALVEVQGYVYAAKRALADLHDVVGRKDDARRLRDEAARLKRLVQEAFWLPTEGCYALALDRHKRPVDSVTSNAGHLLWAGLPDKRYADQVVARLMAPDSFSGWGIRTMASTMAAYNPISYHNGSVWPHDNSLLAAGFRRYGYEQAAVAVANGLIEATRWFDQHRLPELFCGYGRADAPFPVDYPVACSPQAWAAGSIVLLIQELAGISPVADRLQVAPLPHGRTLRLHDVPFRRDRLAITADDPTAAQGAGRAA